MESIQRDSIRNELRECFYYSCPYCGNDGVMKDDVREDDEFDCEHCGQEIRLEGLYNMKAKAKTEDQNIIAELTRTISLMHGRNRYLEGKIRKLRAIGECLEKANQAIINGGNHEKFGIVTKSETFEKSYA